MKKYHLLILLISIFFSCNQESNHVSGKQELADTTEIGTAIIWHWEDNFSPSEKEKIIKYITKVSEATFRLLGNYPFEVHYYFKRSESETEPIPWAHTVRKNKKQGVRFYINPNFGEDILHADWTAPHEISHLSIPYLGKENSWFSEGYASYMQYQIMQELGIYTQEEVNQKYEEKIRNIQSDYSDTMVFTENAKALRSRYNFPALYWGGAKYFMQADAILRRQEGKSLNALVKEYQLDRRKKDKDLESLLNSWDKDLKTPIFRKLYEDCNSKSFGEIYQLN